jgi:YesN/AraC family two-component response regulator
LVSSAKEALRILKEQTPPAYHIVISDIKMPEMDGIELLQAIMSDPELRNIPVISKCDFYSFSFLQIKAFEILTTSMINKMSVILYNSSDVCH